MAAAAHARLRFLLGDLDRVRVRERVPVLVASRVRVLVRVVVHVRDAETTKGGRDLDGVAGGRVRVWLAAALGDGVPDGLAAALDDGVPVCKALDDGDDELVIEDEGTTVPAAGDEPNGVVVPELVELLVAEPVLVGLRVAVCDGCRMHTLTSRTASASPLDGRTPMVMVCVPLRTNTRESATQPVAVPLACTISAVLAFHST